MHGGLAVLPELSLSGRKTTMTKRERVLRKEELRIQNEGHERWAGEAGQGTEHGALSQTLGARDQLLSPDAVACHNSFIFLKHCCAASH